MWLWLLACTPAPPEPPPCLLQGGPEELLKLGEEPWKTAEKTCRPFNVAIVGVVDLSGRDLRAWNFLGLGNLFMPGSRFDGANLEGSNLRGQAFVGTRLVGANLEGADLRGAMFRDADLTDANLQNTKFEWTGTYGATLLRTKMDGISGTGESLVGLQDVQATGWALSRCATSDWTRVHVSDGVYTRCSMATENFHDVWFTNMDLSGCRFYGSLAGVHFDHVDLRGASLLNADLASCVDVLIDDTTTLPADFPADCVRRAPPDPVPPVAPP